MPSAAAAAAAFLLASCASFKSGDIYVSRNVLGKMLDDKSKKPFGSVKTNWEIMPYARTNSRIAPIGDERPVFRPAGKEEADWFREKAEEILSEAELLDEKNGSGTIILNLKSTGNWTYKDVFFGFLTETPWVMIFPASLRVNYSLAAQFLDENDRREITQNSTVKTVFHPLMLPLYVFSYPSGKEKSVIKAMLWKAATDIYAEKSAGAEIKFCDEFELLKRNLNYFSSALDDLPLLSDAKNAIRKKTRGINARLLALQRQCPREKDIPAYYVAGEKEILPHLESLSLVMENLPEYGYPPDACWLASLNKAGEPDFAGYNRLFEIYFCCRKSGSVKACDY